MGPAGGRAPQSHRPWTEHPCNWGSEVNWENSAKWGERPHVKDHRGYQEFGVAGSDLHIARIVWLQDREVDGRESEREDQAKDKQ